ncbi:MAG: hypothetical protein JO339_17300 [Alphaproteobacteria bacterium]|nr:hypothetical protein [Alphaproteobacteria bacterium]
MTEKNQIVHELGETSLLLPTLIADALAANDRLKLGLTLLQEAGGHAVDPTRPANALAAERRATGLDDPQFDSTIAGAKLLGTDRLHVPGAQPLIAGLARDLGSMLAPLQAAGSASFAALEKRRSALVAALPKAERDELAPRDIETMSSARHDGPGGGPDSLHRLVMDAHKAINALAAESALEEIDGARVHHIDDADRPRIKAFMSGLHRTAPLAFGHPGLGTTAARSGTRLTIQNDIGETDAHVIVIHVEPASVTITYTDVHRRRARFFMSLFDGKDVGWSPLAERQAHALSSDAFHLVTGRHVVANEAELLAFLEHLGSRLVFLIDWNKARKALQTFVGKQQAVDILAWAAAHDHGHRGFLELGGADLVFEAVRRAAGGRIPYGVRLDAALGAADCVRFLQRVLRLGSEGLRGNRSARLIRDEVQAELAQLFDTAEVAVLTLLVRHLGVTRTLMSTIAEHLAGDAAAATARPSLARRAKQMEEKADRLTLQARETCARVQGGEPLRLAVDAVENATDALDEAAFLWTLAPTGALQASSAALGELADIVIDSISQLVRAAEAAACLPEGNRVDAATALQAIDAVTTAERRADAAERTAMAALMAQPASDTRAPLLGLEVARALEGATDHLAHAALALRERVLAELSR